MTFELIEQERRIKPEPYPFVEDRRKPLNIINEANRIALAGSCTCGDSDDAPMSDFAKSLVIRNREEFEIYCNLPILGVSWIEEYKRYGGGSVARAVQHDWETWQSCAAIKQNEIEEGDELYDELTNSFKILEERLSEANATIAKMRGAISSVLSNYMLCENFPNLTVNLKKALPTKGEKK